MNPQEIPIRDIKPLVEIPDSTLYILIVLVALVAGIIGIVIYFFAKWLKNRNRFNKKKHHLNELKNIDFSDSKSAAYLITFHAKEIVETDRCKKMLVELNEKLEMYKYRKDVESISDEVKVEFERFLEAVDE